MEQQGSCRVEGGGALEGLGWSSRKATGKWRVLHRRGSALGYSVYTVDSNAGGDLNFCPKRYTETSKSAASALSTMLHPKAKRMKG